MSRHEYKWTLYIWKSAFNFLCSCRVNTATCMHSAVSGALITLWGLRGTVCTAYSGRRRRDGGPSQSRGVMEDEAGSSGLPHTRFLKYLMLRLGGRRARAQMQKEQCPSLIPATGIKHPDVKQLQGEVVYFSRQFQVAVCRSGEVMATRD